MVSTRLLRYALPPLLLLHLLSCATKTTAQLRPVVVAPVAAEEAAPEEPAPPHEPTLAFASGVASLKDGALITAAGKIRKPPPNKAFADLMDDVVLVVPAVYTGFDDVCELREAETDQYIGMVDTKNAFAGGTITECSGLLAHGKAVILKNSRGTYARDVSSGRGLPCPHGAIADDDKTCLRLDTEPQIYTGSSDPKVARRDFSIEICAIENVRCRTLIVIERGLNRMPNERNWDGAYCANDRVAILANGQLYMFDARSRRELSKAPVPASKTRVTCKDGTPVTS